jgi:2'-hydroxyisoflavone reductase
MRILVLGGTRFVGRALVDQAVSRGHDVTTFTRGSHGEPRPGAEALHGDRTRPRDLAALTARDWDAVIDTSVIAPVHVAASADLLAGHAGHYTYLSSLAVYTAGPQEPVTEDSPTWDVPATAAGDRETLGYGPLKAGSERAVVAAFPGRHLIVRPRQQARPHDDVGGLPSCLTRLARGGEVLVPGEPSQPACLTDARDLAAWMVDSIRRGITGTVNVPGPRGHTLGELMNACLSVTRATSGEVAELAWTSDDTVAADVPGLACPWEASGDRAALAGLRYRPWRDTISDTWSWMRQAACL